MLTAQDSYAPLNTSIQDPCGGLSVQCSTINIFLRNQRQCRLCSHKCEIVAAWRYQGFIRVEGVPLGRVSVWDCQCACEEVGCCLAQAWYYL